MRDRDTGRSRGFGFVTYSSSGEADNAIQNMHDQELDGRRIKVNLANARAGTGYNAGGGGGGGFAGGYSGELRWMSGNHDLHCGQGAGADMVHNTTNRSAMVVTQANDGIPTLTLLQVATKVTLLKVVIHKGDNKAMAIEPWSYIAAACILFFPPSVKLPQWFAASQYFPSLFELVVLVRCQMS